MNKASGPVALKWISNMSVIRILEGEMKEGKIEKIFKDRMAENFPDLTRNVNLLSQETVNLI